MGIFKNKDGDPKKVKAAIKKTAKSATKEGGSEAMQSMVKPKRVSTLKRIVKDVPTSRVPVSKLTRSVKTVIRPTPTPTATIQKSTRNSKTGEVTKSTPEKLKMKSISAKEFYK